MLHLILLRHAKAVARDPHADRARKLSDRGHRDAEHIGRYFVAHDVIPELALVSPAVRTRETFDLVSAAFERPIEVVFPEALYGADPHALLEAVAAVPTGVTTLILIGHNPGLGEFARLLAGSGDKKGLRDMAERFPAGAAAMIRFDDEDWRAIAPGGGRLEAFITPDAFVDHGERD